jgi:hypothetical protein
MSKNVLIVLCLLLGITNLYAQGPIPLPPPIWPNPGEPQIIEPLPFPRIHPITNPGTDPIDEPADLSITGFTLVDASLNRDIMDIKDGTILYLDELPNNLTIRANTQPAEVGSVVFYLNEERVIETNRPYAFAGKTWLNGQVNYRPMEPLVEGLYSLSATPYPDARQEGEGGMELSIQFEVKKTNQQVSREAGRVVSFTLIDADKNTDIRELKKGDILYLDELPRNLNIRANTEPRQVGSVLFILNDRRVIESVFPYAYGGEVIRGNQVDYKAMEPLKEGKYDLSATPYSDMGRGGVKGTGLTIDFEVFARKRENFQAGRVNSFTLVDAVTNQDIMEIKDGDILYLDKLPSRHNIRANTAPERVGSVLIRLNNDQVTENIYPYAFAGDYPRERGIDYKPMDPGLQSGRYRLSATPFSERGRNGQRGGELSIQFEVRATDGPAMDCKIEKFVLVDAEKNIDIREIKSGDVLELDKLPARLNIRAHTRTPVGSMRFNVNNKTYRTENYVPYAAAGDREGNYHTLELKSGRVYIKATAYTQKYMRGDRCDEKEISFEVKGKSGTDKGDPSKGGRVASFHMVDAKDGKVLFEIKDGDKVYLDRLPQKYTIIARTAPDNVGSVLFRMGSKQRVDNSNPYTLAGDKPNKKGKREYNAMDRLAVGQHSISATPYSKKDRKGDRGQALAIQFEVLKTRGETPTTPQPEPTVCRVERFVLVDASTNRDIKELKHGDVLNLSDLPAQLNIRAHTPGKVGSMRFDLNDRIIRTDNTMPYSMFGDMDGNYQAMNLQEGKYDLKAVAFTEANIMGRSCDELEISFEIIKGEPKGEDFIAAYPNPFHSSINLSLSPSLSGSVSVEIYDIQGNLIEKLFEGEVREGEQTELRFDGSALRSGVYLARITSSRGASFQRLMLQR